MSSANEHLPPPPKPRMSPLDFRNTDLVSRLLAATPPYLYNMSLLPNTYFFSEMLRSFVQAKAERASSSITNNSTPALGATRKSRKRTWSTNRSECFAKPVAKEKHEPSAEWMLKSSRSEENPLELTTNKENTNESESKNVGYSSKIEPFVKPDEQLYSQFHPSSQDSSSNLVLPPPPPIWYPPIYPTAPYGIDPLHFFIDLRVSGHIYDRKNHSKDSVSSFSPATTSKVADPVHFEDKIDDSTDLKDIFKQPRHLSAFSVPVPNGNKQTMNTSPTKFDIISMGFDKSDNKTSTTYIMNNIKNIYQTIHENKQEINEVAVIEETEEEREKRVKDLRALIGLELVVDYMNHAKPGQQMTRNKEENPQNVDSLNSTDLESVGSPTLEVVDIHDET